MEGATGTSEVPITAVERLPEEMWDNVVGYLTKEVDVLSSYNTCALFREFVKPKVYAQALAVVQRQVAETRFELTETDILSCRLVSRDWKKMTDHFLQSRESRLDLSCDRPYRSGFQPSFNDQLLNAPNQYGAICLRMGNLEEADSLVQQITKNGRVRTGANVLVGRHVIIVGHRGCLFQYEDANNPEKQRFYDIVSRLLTACGRHVWYLSLCDSISGGLPHLLFNTYYKWLRMVPHLRMLTCQITMGKMTPGKELETQTALQEGATQQPFPHLSQLVTLQCNGIPDTLVHSALDVNRHVKKVEVVPLRYGDNLLNIEQWRNTPLTEFCLDNCKVDEFKQMTETGWPLEKLSVRFDSGLGNDDLQGVERYLQQLRNFGTTLKYLRLDVPLRPLYLVVENPQWYLQLPDLEELHLDMIHGVRLDFMLPLTSLKKLKLSIVYFEAGGQQPKVQFQGLETSLSDLYHSFIWDDIKTLKEVEVKLYMCVTRKFLDFKFNRNERSRFV